jgi:hypothetical protein
MEKNCSPVSIRVLKEDRLALQHSLGSNIVNAQRLAHLLDFVVYGLTHTRNHHPDATDLGHELAVDVSHGGELRERAGGESVDGEGRGEVLQGGLGRGRGDGEQREQRESNVDAGHSAAEREARERGG